MALVDFDRLAARYVEELLAEGSIPSARVSASAVLADLARLAGVKEPWFLDLEASTDYPEGV